MGARTLEARLRARLLALAVPALALVACVAVGAAWQLLNAADSATARDSAVQLREMFHRELGENDTAEKAVSELREGLAPTGVLFSVRRDGALISASGGAVPGELARGLQAGTCQTERDGAGHYWRGCAVGDARETAIVAVNVDAHRAAVLHLGEVLAAVVLLVLAGLVLSLRSALRAPLSELGALVRWTTEPVEERKSETPHAATREIGQLTEAFDALVQRLLDALARERATSAHIAHELRTPLTALSAELEASEPASEAERARIARMRDDVARLAHAIDAILVLSDGTERLRSETIVNVADLVRELATDRVNVEAPDEALVEGDERLLAMAVQNLLDNAARYGGGARRIRLASEEGLLRLAVIDEGPGLGAAARARMFERYFRASADGDGKGLGLAFVRAVAERHGGRAEARPGPGDRGLEVSMLLGPVAGWH